MSNSTTPKKATTTDNNTPLLIRIDDKWMDVRRWSKSHPGGAECLELLDGLDATDQFYALHSEEAVKKLKGFGAEKAPETLPPAPSQASVNFRKFREQLRKEGWFNRSWFMDSLYVLAIVVLCTVGTYLAPSHPWIASVLIGVGMQQAGWVAHDHIHGRGTVCFYLGHLLGGLVNGFSRSWWEQKHNTHHIHTNHVEIDEDIQNDPLLHLFIPEESEDVSYRKYQHMYFHVLFAFLFVSWRIQSFQYAYKNGLTYELIGIAVNAIWLLSLPWQVTVASILIGGLLVAEVVTATHQSEEMVDEVGLDYIEQQFRTTRDVVTGNFLMEYLWGGMQYQLEHHIFPTLPRYYHPALVPLVKRFAQENNLDYRESGVMEILKMNYETYAKYAAPAVKDGEGKKYK